MELRFKWLVRLTGKVPLPFNFDGYPVPKHWSVSVPPFLRLSTCHGVSGAPGEKGTTPCGIRDFSPNPGFAEEQELFAALDTIRLLKSIRDRAPA